MLSDSRVNISWLIGVMFSEVLGTGFMFSNSSRRSDHQVTQRHWRWHHMIGVSILYHFQDIIDLFMKRKEGKAGMVLFAGKIVIHA